MSTRNRHASTWGFLGALLALSLASTSCGGGGGGPGTLGVVEFTLVGHEGEFIGGPGSLDMPRNAKIHVLFTRPLDPGSVTDQTFQVRTGPTLQTLPDGFVTVDGNLVRFDPSLEADGTPNALGLDPLILVDVRVPAFTTQDGAVTSLRGQPMDLAWQTRFQTGEGYVQERHLPEVTGVRFVPPQDPLTGEVPGDAVMLIDFSEAMHPASFQRGALRGPDAETTIDIRFAVDALATAEGLVTTTEEGAGAPIGIPVPGTLTPNDAADQYVFRPTFSFGHEKFTFFVDVRQGVTDLAGNQLLSRRSFGPYVVDGEGIRSGKILEEAFVDALDRDPVQTDARWGSVTVGTLEGAPVTSREAHVFSYQEADAFGARGDSGRGQYAPFVDPLIGASLNTFVTGVSPPTVAGRRVAWAISDTELGADGTITAAGWGPDSNATFAATYPEIILRMGYQSSASMTLTTTFAGNQAAPPVEVFRGEYTVSQRANIGNTPGHPARPHAGGYAVGGGCTTNWNQPLFQATGFEPWPALTAFFEWDEGDPRVGEDSVLVFDASVAEGDNFQQIRGWFATTGPCSGALIPGYPSRRLYSIHNGFTAVPPTSVANAILNPEPSVMDLCFTITKLQSTGQSLFYFPAGHASQAAHGETFGPLTDYRPAELEPSVQVGGAQVRIEYQGADLVEADRSTINLAGAFTDWTPNVDDCDGFPCLRWRVRLISNILSSRTATLRTVRIPMVQSNP